MNILGLFVTSVLIMSSVFCAEIGRQPTILDYNNENDGTGNYKFGFKTSDGIEREEIGELVDRGTPNEHISVEGSYYYTGPDGKEITVHYVADENGFRIVSRPEIMLVSALPSPLIASLVGK